MTNMMNGAVAIYGGVGVMETRQPLPQTVESILKYLIAGGDLSLYGLSNAVTRASQDVAS